MTESENIQILQKWEKKIKQVKELEGMEMDLEKAIQKVLSTEAEFRLKFMIKSEKRKSNPSPFPDDFAEYLSETGYVRITPKNESDNSYKTLVDVKFPDDFVMEFLLYWYKKTKTAKENLISKPI